MNKLVSDKNTDRNSEIAAKLKDLVGVSTRKLGAGFVTKISAN